MTNIITISGQPGSGTTTMAKALTDRLNATYVNAGSIFRALADEHGMTLDEFSKYVNENPDIDREIDFQLRRAVDSYLGTEATARSTGERREDLDLSIDIEADAPYLILESRLAGWIAGPDATLRVWCQAPLDVRCARVDGAGDRDEQADALVERQSDEAMRYREWYDIDITDTTIYDLVVNTSRWDETTTTDLVEQFLASYNPTGDEGPSPTDSPFF